MVLPISYDASDGDATDDDAIVREAYERYQACKEWQGAQDDKAREDIKFANGDPLNGWQWPQEIVDRRTSEGDDLPCLTINVVRVHNDLIINAMSKNSYGIKIRPTGGSASYESAKVMQSLINRIQNVSQFSSQRRKVAEHQVDGGIGYMLISTAWAYRSFNQEIYLRAAQDPTAIMLDPWIKNPDGSDAKFGFEFERMSRKAFNRKYPDWKGKVAQAALNTEFAEWLNDKEITVCKYWRKNTKKDLLIGYTTDDGDEKIKLRSEIKEEAGKELFDKLMDDIKNGVIDGRTREVELDDVQWFLIAGSQVIDKDKWAGKYVPICRCPGREIVIDGTLDRKGHTRPLINAQHMLNYNASVSVEAAATAPKAQWLGSARAFDGMEQWKDANIKRYSALTYNDVDEEAPVELQKIDPPTRIEPAQPSPAFLQGMQDAERQIMMISGQFQAQMGENDTQSAASGKAIGERQQQGDTATYHFPEHQSDMLRFIGVQLLDLIPKIYDTGRALQVEDAQGERRWLQIDPTMDDALEVLHDERDEEEAIRLAFNPAIGEYECVSDPGPSYATQRQEAWNAFSLIMQQNQWVASCAADLLFKVGDFPGAEELAERLKKEIKAQKAYLFDDTKEPQLMLAQQQLQRLNALNAELMQKLAMKEITLKGKSELRDVEASNAETKRLQVIVDALAKVALTPRQRAEMEHEVAMHSRDHISGIITAANQTELDMQKDAASSENLPNGQDTGVQNGQ